MKIFALKLTHIAFAYNVSIVMGREKMERQEGKLKLYLEGPGFRQKIPLSPE